MPFHRRHIRFFAALALAFATAACGSASGPAATAQPAATPAAPDNAASADVRMQWWRDARYGMFIHWGPYAVAGGEWKGKSGYDEWMMNHAKIPTAEYRKALVENLRAEDFDAAEWVKLAKDAGMKYIVFTAKHHDGFAMFDTKVSDYNIVKAAPFGRDPVRELADEARRQGLRFGVYYSHILDWSSPDATPDSFNNKWEFELDRKRFDRYWKRTVLPHVTELLTRYGDIAEVWFDIGKETPDANVRELLALVRRLQPNALVNNRIKSFSERDYGDFVSMGDNEIPQAGFARDFESAMTLNNHWGYNRADQNWKSADAVVLRLVDVAGKGGNLLLNVGPTGSGKIPQPSQDILRGAARWLARNGEAIYGTRPLRTPYEFDWGTITARPGKLYLNVIDWRPGLVLHGLEAKVERAYLLGSPKRPIEFAQDKIPGSDVPRLSLRLPAQAPDKPVSVVVLETGGEAPRMSRELLQQGSGAVTLDMAAARLEADAAKPENNAARWTFRAFAPGDYRVDLVSLYRPDKPLAYRDPVRIELNGQRFSARPSTDSKPENARSTQHPYAEAVSHLGNVRIDKPGTYTLTLRSELAIPDSTARRVPWQMDRTKLRGLILHPAARSTRGD